MKPLTRELGGFCKAVADKPRSRGSIHASETLKLILFPLDCVCVPTQGMAFSSSVEKGNKVVILGNSLSTEQRIKSKAFSGPGSVS